MDDTALLARATLGNINWSAEHFTERDVEIRQEFRHYTELLPERGDFGTVAEATGGSSGVCGVGPASTRSSTWKASVVDSVSSPSPRWRPASDDSTRGPVACCIQRRSSGATTCHVGRSTWVRTQPPDDCSARGTTSPTW